MPAACANFPDPARALVLLNALETVRLEACIARALPGLAREMAAMRGGSIDPSCASLLEPSTTIHDSIALLDRLYHAPPKLDCPYMGVLEPEHAAAAREARIGREKSELQAALARLMEDRADDDENAGASRFPLDLAESSHATQQYSLELDGTPLTPPPDVGRLIESILQDLGDIPEDYLVPAGDGGLREPGRAERDPADVWKGIYHEEGAYFYNEWDHRRRHYRKNWCVVRELSVHPGDPGFVDATLAKYSPQIAQLKRTFELLRGDERLLKRPARR